MAVNKRQILHPDWSYHHRGVAKGLQICSVTIYNEQLANRAYNATTNTWDSTQTAIWAGNARIQHVRNENDRNLIGNNTITQTVQVQIDFSGNTISGSSGAMVDIRPGNFLVVNSSPIDPMLQKFVYIVKSVVNSSNPWVRTLLCDVDMEADPSA